MPRTSLTKLLKMKQKGEKITSLTAYDASFAQLMEQAGIDIILVGDSLGMVIQGKESTVPVSMQEMIYHTQIVSRATKSSMIMADLPFATTYTPEVAYQNAARLMAEGEAQIVKIEGGQVMLKTIAYLSERGIPVCAHLGLLPQSVYKMGGYKVQGKDHESAKQIINEAALMEDAGADIVLLECVPKTLATEISKQLTVPVIGIGAGNGCDAQVLVCYDMLGITHGGGPSFSKNFLRDTGSVIAAFEAYKKAVKSGQFPNDDQSF